MIWAGLSPGFVLALLGGITAVVVLLYLLRLKRRVLVVPHVPLWEGLGEESRRPALWTRLRRWLSMLLQWLIAALMVFALGDPRLSDEASGCGGQATASVVDAHQVLLVDSSLSMGTLEEGASRFERAVDFARRHAREALKRDGVRLILLETNSVTRHRTLWTSNPEVIDRALDDLLERGASHHPSSREELERAVVPLLAGRVGPEILLFSDGAMEVPAALEVEGAEVPIQLARVGSATDNVGIVAMNVRPQLGDRLGHAVLITTRNESDRPVDVTVILYAHDQGQDPARLDDEAHAVTSFQLQLPPRGEVTHHLEDVTFTGSRLAARLVVNPEAGLVDRLSSDNVALSLVPPRPPLLVQLHSEDNLFLEAALLVRRDLLLSRAGADDDPVGLERPDLIIVDRVAPPSMTPGRYLVIDPPDSPLFKHKGQVRNPRVIRVNGSHPVTRGLKLVDLEIEVATRYESRPGDRTLVQGSGSAPLIFERLDETTNRSFIVVAFDVRRSQFPLRYGFPLLVANVLEASRQVDASSSRSFPLAEGAVVPDTLPPGPLTLSGPEDAEVHARRLGGDIHVRSSRIGAVQVVSPGAETPVEVSFQLGDPGEVNIASRIDAAPWTPQEETPPEEAPWPGLPWRALLMFALAGIVVEWWTWHRGWTL